MQIVSEVITNVPEKFGNASSQEFRSLRVRGKELTITPETINAFYGTNLVKDFEGEHDFNKIAHVLTRNERACWVDQNLPSSEMSTEFSLLFDIGIKN